MIKILTHSAILCFFFRVLTDQVAYIYLGTILGFILFLLLIFKYNKISIEIIFLIILSSIGYVFSLINNNFDGALFFPQLIACIGIAWGIKTHGISQIFTYLLFYATSFYFFFGLLIINMDLWEFFAYSNNHISVIFINLTALIYISTYNKRSITLIPVIITFIASSFALGFGGIISSSFFLVFLIMYRFEFNIIFRIIFLSLFFYALYLIYIYYLDIINFVVDNYSVYILYFNGNDLLVKLNEIKNDTYQFNRYDLWLSYYNDLTLGSFIFGSPLIQEYSFYIQDKLSFNMHNSFILLHQRIGIFSFYIFYFFIYSFLVNFRKNYIFSVLIFILSLRAMTDTTFFAGSAFDFIILYLLFYSYKKV